MTQAMTGHKSQKLVEHYGVLPSSAQRAAMQTVECELNVVKSGRERRSLKLV